MKPSRQAKIMLKWTAFVASLAVLIVAATVTPSCQRVSAGNQARRATTVATLACIRAVLAMRDPLPSTLTELTVGSKSQPALLTGISLRDSWGQPFLYRESGGTNFLLRSSGPDRRMGTRDDIF